MISIAMDGTEDDKLWEGNCDISDGQDDPDICDDQVIAEQWKDLFGDSDDRKTLLDSKKLPVLTKRLF